MSNPNEPLRDRLLSQSIPEPGRLATYRKEVEAMLEREERSLQRQAWLSGAVWIWAVFLATAFALVAGYASDKPIRVYFSLGVMVLAMFIYGAVEMLKLFINRARLEVVKDIKGLELRLIEMEGRLQDRTA
jgi:undecaprenyl pyrophosphate phosphatase UppP